MTQAVLALSAGSLCALAGLRYASSLRQEAVRLAMWTDALRRLRLLLEEGTLPLPEALRQAGAGLPGPDRLMADIASSMNADPLLSLPDAMERSCQLCPERALLLRLSQGLSHGSLESRCLACEHACAAMSQLSAEAAGRAARDAKLFQTLGFTGGACLTLLLL